MEFTCEHILPAPPEAVMAMYTNPAFFTRKYHALGLRNIEVQSTHHDARRFEIACRFERKASIEVPKIAQRFVGGSDWLWTTQRDAWDLAARTGRLDITVDAFASVVKIRSDMKLEPHPQGAVNRMRWTIDCSVPLIGGALAKFLGQDIQRKSVDDGELSVRLLPDFSMGSDTIEIGRTTE